MGCNSIPATLYTKPEFKSYVHEYSERSSAKVKRTYTIHKGCQEGSVMSSMLFPSCLIPDSTVYIMNWSGNYVVTHAHAHTHTRTHESYVFNTYLLSSLSPLLLLPAWWQWSMTRYLTMRYRRGSSILDIDSNMSSYSFSSPSLFSSSCCVTLSLWR